MLVCVGISVPHLVGDAFCVFLPGDLPLAVRYAAIPRVAPPQRPQQEQGSLDQRKVRMRENRAAQVAPQPTGEAMGARGQLVHLGHGGGTQHQQHLLPGELRATSRDEPIRRIPKPAGAAVPAGSPAKKSDAGAAQPAPAEQEG